jgi:hypothetical protein
MDGRAQPPPASNSFTGGRYPMMNDMMNMMGGMGWSMGLVSILIVLLLVLGIAALVKYLFSR